MGCGSSTASEEKKEVPPLCLPHQVSPELKKTRDEAIAKQRSVYDVIFDQFEGKRLPPRVKELSPDETHNMHLVNQFVDLTSTQASLGLNSVLEKVSSFVLGKTDPYKVYSDYYRTSTVPAVAARWKDDLEFARQRINGVNPTLLYRLDTLPPNVPISDDILRGLLPASAPGLQQLLQQKRLFAVNYKRLDLIRPYIPSDSTLCSPIAIFCIDDSKELAPLGIQLFQNPSPANPVFTPNPSHTTPGAWMHARMHCQAADILLHEVEAHLFSTHLYTESIYVAMMRNLPPVHPVHQLVKPHFWGTMAVDFKGREVLLGENAIMPRLMGGGNRGTIALLAQAWSDHHFMDNMHFPSLVKRRGLETLPWCPFRDDGLEFWAVLEAFVKDIVNSAYWTEGDVAKDSEMANWFQELGSMGIIGLPCQKPTTRQHIITFLTCLIFTATAGHTMVNGPQWDFVGFVPNAPGKFHMKALQSTKVELSDADIAKALPQNDDSIEQIVVVKTLSAEPHEAAMLGEYPEGHLEDMSGDTGGAAVQRFKSGLAQLSSKIQQRENSLQGPNASVRVYPYLDPAKVCNSVCM